MLYPTQSIKSRFDIETVRDKPIVSAIDNAGMFIILSMLTMTSQSCGRV